MYTRRIVLLAMNESKQLVLLLQTNKLIDATLIDRGDNKAKEDFVAGFNGESRVVPVSDAVIADVDKFLNGELSSVEMAEGPFNVTLWLFGDRPCVQYRTVDILANGQRALNWPEQAGKILEQGQILEGLICVRLGPVPQS